MTSIILILGLLILVGCNKDRLKKVDNILVNKNVITFDEVLNAEKYILDLNGTLITLNEPTYTILEPGEYQVRVKATANKYEDSLYSNFVSVVVKYLEYPKNIKIFNYQLQYDLVADATSYNIEINGEVYNTLTDHVPTFEVGTYEIRIKALSDVYINSEYSPLTTFVIDEDQILQTKQTYRYSVNSSFDLSLFDYGDIITDVKLTMGSIQIENQNLIVLNNSVYLKSSFLKTLDVGKNQLLLETNLGEHQITIEISERITPYIYSNVNIKYEGEDVSYLYEMFDYEFKAIIDDYVDLNDYLFKDNKLIVKNEFVNRYFSENEEKQDLILSLLFEKNNGDTAVTFILINR